jgi:hypothetical protein
MFRRVTLRDGLFAYCEGLSCAANPPYGLPMRKSVVAVNLDCGFGFLSGSVIANDAPPVGWHILRGLTPDIYPLGL